MFKKESNVQPVNPSGLSAASNTYVSMEAKTKVTKKNGPKKMKKRKVEIFFTFLMTKRICE